MNKFEQLIEYVINDEEDKARELFHSLVVEKSCAIYEEMMADEESEFESDEEIEENEQFDGDASNDLIGDIESEEQGFGLDAENDDSDDFELEADTEDEFTQDDSDNEELEDRVVDLEDKLDELMAEFESLMSDDASRDEYDDEDEAETFSNDESEDDESEDEDEEVSMNEAISLKSAPTPVKSEEGNINKKSVVAANSGSKGSSAKPVKPTGTEAQGRSTPSSKELIGKVGNTPAQSTQKPTPANKPKLSQAEGVNTKSVIQ